VLPGQIDEQVAEYGLIGAVFVLSIWLMVLSAVLLGGTLFGAVLIQRRTTTNGGGPERQPITD